MGYLIEHETNMTVCWIQKCGCTLLKGIFYNLNTGDMYPDLLAIHNDKAAVANIRYSPRRYGPRDESKSFVVMREPTARFLSFYWDKVYSHAPYASDSARGALERRARVKSPDFEGFDRSDDLSLDGHVANLHALLDGLEVSFARWEKLRQDKHYMRQSVAIDLDEASDCTRIRLESFRDGVPASLAAASPRFSEAFEKMPHANESVKKYKNSEVLDDEILARVRDLYSKDFEMYEGIG